MKNKENNRRKQIVFLAAVCLCISCFTACKGGVTTSDSVKDDTSLNTTVTPAADITTPAADITTPADTAESTAGWQIVKSFTYTHKVNVLAFYSPDFGVTAGYSGEIHYSNDQGDTWPRAQNSTACLFGIDMVNKDVAFACGNKENVTKTTDGGKTWNKVTDFGGSEPYQCKLLSFIDENTGLIASDYKLAYTSDSGITWTELTLPVKSMALYLTSAEKGYIIGQDNKMYVTNDAGSTWVAQDLNVEGFENAPKMAHGCAFAIAEDGTGQLFYIDKNEGTLKCFETSDSGLTWTKSSELSTVESDIRYKLLYLSHDGKCLTLQAISTGAGAIATRAE